MMTNTIDQTLLTDLKVIENEIVSSERPSIEARWESGRKILTFYELGKKQLAPGRLNEIAEALDVHRSEIGARIKFARKCPTKQALSTAVETFKSWSAIKAKALTDKPRPTAERDSIRSPLHSLLAMVESIDPATLDQGDLPLVEMLRESVQRLAEGIVALKAAS